MKITLAITTFNRARQLYRTLQRFEVLTKPDELIIIDDGSEQNIGAIVREFKRRLGIPIRYQYLERPGYDVCCVARNVALKMCKTEYFMTSEPEIIFVSDVIAQFRDMIQKGEKRVISAGLVHAMKKQADINTLMMSNPQSYLKHCLPGSFDTRKEWVASYTAIYKTQDLLDIGGWDEDFSHHNGGGGYAFDETDLLTRLRVKGINQLIAKDIEVIHQWHKPVPNELGDRVKINEQIFLDKDLENSKEHIVANKNRDWGKS